MKLGRVIDELVGSQGQEIAEHDLAHGPQPGQGEAIAEADNGSLADGRI